jgi:hypothetical protein
MKATPSSRELAGKRGEKREVGELFLPSVMRRHCMSIEPRLAQVRADCAATIRFERRVTE